MATALAAVGALVMSGGLVMLGAATAVANGNNGTLKILNATSGAAFVDNEPKVCTFKYEGFFFDPGQTGNVMVTGQGQTEFGPANAGSVTANSDGYFITPVQTLATGHYKAEFQSGDDSSKFKSKVFKVNCEVVTITTPAAPRTADPCGPSNIAFVVPPDTDQLDWTLLQNGNVTVAPQPGYQFSGESQLVTFQLPADSNDPCDSTVTIDPPGAPPTTDPCGPSNIAFVVPADTAQLDYTLLGNGNVTVAPKAGYVFSGNSQLITFTLPADSNAPCATVVTIDPPGAPPRIDPCDPGNIRFEVPADTGTLNYELLANGNVTVAPQSGYVFSGNSQLITFTLPADSGIPCPLGVEEIAPEITFTDPDCNNLDGADWSGNLTDIVAYEVTGTPGLGESILVTASIKPAFADQYAFPEGFDATVDHTYPTLAELECVLGEETVVPSPKSEKNPPVVLGTEAAVPTQVNAGMASLPGTGTSTNALLAQLLVAAGLVLLVAGAWVGFAGRDYGKHHI